MERAGQPRHRLHNPSGEGERAGCDRINPSVGGLVNGMKLAAAAESRKKHGPNGIRDPAGCGTTRERGETRASLSAASAISPGAKTEKEPPDDISSLRLMCLILTHPQTSPEVDVQGRSTIRPERSGPFLSYLSPKDERCR
jgi:hypothetical protein